MVGKYPSMGNSDNDLDGNNNNTVKNQKSKLDRSPVVVENIRQQSFQNISQFMRQLFDSCDDLSNQANNNCEQGLYEFKRVENLIKANMTATNETTQKEDLGISQATGMREVNNKPKTAIARPRDECSKISHETLQQVHDMKPGVNWMKPSGRMQS